MGRIGEMIKQGVLCQYCGRYMLGEPGDVGEVTDDTYEPPGCMQTCKNCEKAIQVDRDKVVEKSKKRYVGKDRDKDL
jgi:hypothetical protein